MNFGLKSDNIGISMVWLKRSAISGAVLLFLIAKFNVIICVFDWFGRLSLGMLSDSSTVF